MPHIPGHKKKKKKVFVQVEEKGVRRTVEPGTPEHEFRVARAASSRGVVKGDVTPEEHRKRFLKRAEDKPFEIGEKEIPETPDQAPIPEIDPRKKGILDQIAEWGVAPAVFTANLISGGIEAVSGQKIGKITTEQFAATPVGKGLGLATVAAEVVLGGVIIAKLLGTFGAGAVAKGTGGKLTITKTASELASGKELASITTQKAVQALGGGTSKVNLLFKAAQNLTATQAKFLLTKSAWLKVGAVTGGLSATSGVMTWMAADNIMQGTSIMTRDLSFAVRSGTVSKEEALSLLEEAQGWKNRAETFVKINSKVNPVLWPFGKILLTNAKVAQAQLDLQRQNIIMAGFEE